MARPVIRLLGLALGIVITVVVLYRNFGFHPAVSRLHGKPPPVSGDEFHVPPDMQKGDAIMGHLGNETIKADLGRAAWKLFHTTMAQFPDKPSEEESAALKSYIYLFARLYPCRDCAQHFQTILKDYPPQSSSRSAAAAWGCHVHNEVNRSKGKPEFDCAKIGDFYDCGCGGKGDSPQADEKLSNWAKMDVVQDGQKSDLGDLEPAQIAKEGPTRGG